MGIKLHGFNTSTATLRVVAALHEKEIDFQFVFVNLRAAIHKQQPFLSLNPFGQVPAFEDGDLVLFANSNLRRIRVWLEVEALQFDIPGSALAWELIYKNKIYDQQPDESAVEENETNLANVLDVYESRLGKSKYLGGDTFTLADLHHLPILHLLMGTKVKKLFDQRPRVSAWSKDILARPSWQKAIAMWDQVYN